MISAKDFNIVSSGPEPARSNSTSSAPGNHSPSGSTTPAPDTNESAHSTHSDSARETSFFNALLDVVSDLVFEIRKDGSIVSFHAPRGNEFGLSAELVVGHRVMDLLTTHVGQLVMHYLEKAFRTETPQTFCCQYMLPGKLRFFETRIAVHGPGVAVAVVRDVTDRETIEKELVESSHRAQSRIGQDIHDGLGQHLTGITFLSRALENKLAAKGLPEAADAAEISKLVIEALAQTRNLARGLCPVEIESAKLCQSLRELATAAEHMYHIACSVECDSNLTINNPNASTHLFRLAQEAINNAVKHGKAQRVSILLGSLGDKAVLRIIDDGMGFPVNDTRKNGLGLRIMTYRAQKVGGILEIQPGQHGGTVVTCTFNPHNDEN